MLNIKKFYATFVSLIFAIVLMMSTAMIVQATVYPGVPTYPAHPGKLLPVVGNTPEFGYYGGYFPMWDRIMPSLDTVLNFSSASPSGNYFAMADDWSFWDQIWDEPGWQFSTQDTGGTAPGGWDLTAVEWWTMPTGMLWMDAILLSEAVPPDGFNIFPYLNDRSDELYWKYQAAEPAVDRKFWMDEWQVELLTNPPVVNVYSPWSYSMYGSYINNYYGTVWWYDFMDWAINSTKVTEIFNAGNMTEANKDRLLVTKAINYGVTEDVWNFNPAFIATYTEETMANIVTGTLYAMSISELPPQGQPANFSKFTTKPELASGPPVISGGGLIATIPLKNNITWSDGVPFNATDVKYSLDLNLVSSAKAVALGDFAPIVSAVNLVPGDPYSIELVLHRPYNDLENILSNSWGLGILPEHYYRGIPVSALRGHASNWDWNVAKNAPTIGAYNLTSVTTAKLTYEKNTKWWGNDWGFTIQDTIDEINLVKVEDASTRFSQIQTHELDFGEYSAAPVAAYNALVGSPDLTVIAAPYVATNPVWFNLNNPYLSNRYVRLAIAYAIPYADIWTNVVPAWGVTNTVPGGTIVHPWHVYTDNASNTVNLFNTVTPDYTYNPAWAQAYLNMWKLSRIAHASNASGLWVNGPVGDADFNGLVELDDYKVWFNNFGNTEAGHTFDPGNDEDADFNNDDVVNTDDFALWGPKFGVYYPAGNTTKTYDY